MRFQIEHRIGVQAPAAEVWAHLGDLANWPAWNPMYPKASGRLRIGEVLAVDEATPDMGVEAIAPSVVDWVPDAQIVWTRKFWGGLVQRTRYFEINALTDQGCVFSNGEMFDGRIARFVPRQLRRRLKRGFVGVGEALKARIESGTAARAEADLCSTICTVRAYSRSSPTCPTPVDWRRPTPARSVSRTCVAAGSRSICR